MKNIVAYNSITTGFFDNNTIGWGDASNNASDDGTHPGTDGVLITADPFEADGYTPSQGGQLDAAGIDVGVILGADGQPFALFPAIGAYPTYIPSDSVAPILTNPTSEGDFQGLLCKVDTDEAYGVLFAVATDTATKPEPEQVEAGQDHLGATANDSNLSTVTTAGSQSLLMGNVEVGSTQYVHFVHKDASGNYSLVVTAASIVVPTYYAQVIYDGMVIPPDSILHLYDGTHTGADASTTLTTALDLTLDAVVGRVCKNTADGSEGIITGNTAGPNSVITVTLAGGTDNLFDTGDTYEIQIDADNPDVIWYDRTTIFVGDSASFSWYLEDVSEDQLSTEYTAIYTLSGQPDGTYNITINDKGVVSFDYIGNFTLNLTDDLINGDVLSNIQGDGIINGHNLVITGSIENITSLYKLTIYLTGTNSIGTVINPGTGYGQVNILYPVPITVTVTDSDTKLPIELAAVQLYLTSDYSTEVISGLTDAMGVITTTYNYIPSVGDVGVEGWVRQMDLLNDDYTPKDISGEITENGLAIAVSLTKL
ncbi:MAG: hypothetical protein GY814_01955 [Gammaproteobacteria bacterium]|nr:hypothetical protein [Gammaproteobacteria bacterium]